ncbi:hypothetical protein CGJ15_10885 [Vibrio parahaemolyticus]|nr:hypothetical protein CGJ15_10885 [Vibrio parahaemolyticus]
MLRHTSVYTRLNWRRESTLLWCLPRFQMTKLIHVVCIYGISTTDSGYEALDVRTIVSFRRRKNLFLYLRSRRSVECDISLSSRAQQPFSPNLEGKLADLSEVPKQTLCFYQERIDKEEQSLLFFRTPRVRFKGTVDLKIGYEITNV